MKIQLGKTPEDQEKERAAKQREMEAEIQKRNQERQAKIEALHKLQTRNKIIIYVFIIILFVSMMTFGIYNIFVKKNMTPEEVEQIAVSVNNYFPTDGVEGYLSRNIDNLFNKYAKPDNTVLKSMDVDETSLYITKIQKINDTVAQVDFIVTVDYVENDKEVTDAELIKILQQNGLKNVSDQLKTTTETPTTEQPIEQPVATTTDATEEVIEENSDDVVDGSTFDSDLTVSMVDADGNVIESVEVNGNETEETTEETTTEEPTTEEIIDDTTDETTDEDYTQVIEPNSIKQANSEKQVKEYYISGDNIIYQVGDKYSVRYELTVPIEYYELIIQDENEQEVHTGATGYKLAGDLNIRSLERVDQTDFTEIQVYDLYEFYDDTLADENTTNQAQIKVNQILKHLYEGEDVSQEFFNTYKFNTYGATYKGITSFVLYTQPNDVGFNAYLTYTIEVNHMLYEMHTYLYVEQDGSTWKITKFM